MSNHRVYIAGSTQKENIGIKPYGSEQDRMQYFSDRVKYWLETQKGLFDVFRNQSGWSLEQTVKDCNALACELFIDNHTNAGSPTAEGTEIYYYGPGGVTGNSYRLGTTLYRFIAPISPGKDRGVIPDTSLYKSGLYVLQHTTPPAVLIEHIFHTNKVEVDDFLSRIDVYAKAEAQAACAYCGEKWTEPITPVQSIETLVEELIKDGVVTDRALWEQVLKGIVPAKPEYLQIAFRRAVDKIK